jgi:hypothetical protein
MNHWWCGPSRWGRTDVPLVGIPGMLRSPAAVAHATRGRTRLAMAGRVVTSAVIAAGVLVVTGCTAAAPASGSPPASSSGLGRFPIAAPPPPTTPSASPGHAQLVSMGDPVAVSVGNSMIVVTATGPDLPGASQLSPGATPPTRLPGTITLTAQDEHGAVVVRAADLSVTDGLGQPVSTTAKGCPGIRLRS